MPSSSRRACLAKSFVVALTLAVPAVVGPLVRVGAAAGDAATISEPDAPALSFREFFKRPIGPRGLEPTDKLLRASGISVCVCEPDRQSTPRHESSRGRPSTRSSRWRMRPSAMPAPTSRRNVRLTSGRGGPLGVPPTPGAE